MSKDRLRTRYRWVFAPAAILAALIPLPAAAQAQEATAHGSVEVTTESVGTGIAYNLLTDALSAVFLSGQPGDLVSFELHGLSRNPNLETIGSQSDGMVVLSTASYRLDLGTPITPSPRPGRLDAGPLQLILGRFGELPGLYIILAQFN